MTNTLVPVNDLTASSEFSLAPADSLAPAGSRMIQQFTRSQEELIRDIICQGSSPEEFRLFVAQCLRTGLDPFSRQIWAVMRNASEFKNGQKVFIKKMTIQVSIDGLRLIAERSKKYEGQLGPFWCGEDGQWTDLWMSDKPPFAAKVGVWKTGFREPLWRVAKWTSYAVMKDGKPESLWAKMPDLMLAKCAESLALRSAFPHETSGLYTREEMMQADNSEPPPSERQASPERQASIRQAEYQPRHPEHPAQTERLAPQTPAAKPATAAKQAAVAKAPETIQERRTHLRQLIQSMSEADTDATLEVFTDVFGRNDYAAFDLDQCRRAITAIETGVWPEETDPFENANGFQSQQPALMEDDVKLEAQKGHGDS